MSTTEQLVETGRRRRRRHSPQFKAEAVGACQQAGVSVAAVALARGINANLLRRWVQAADRRKAPIAIQSTAPTAPIESGEAFLPIAIQSEKTEAPIRIELRRRGRSVSIEWPTCAARECALLLRELMR